MYQLRRLRLRGIGAQDCRFDPLDLDFTDGLRPVDSVVWLRNGGGKTALLSLILALLHPRRQDFLGHARSHKSLEDHVLSGDTSHVVAEWQLGGSGARLCTGMVLEWPGRQRTRDHSDCRRAWYLFRPRVRLSIDALPITDDDGRVRSRAAFLDELRGAGRADVELRLRIAEQQQDWRRILNEAGLDPEMFRYQVRMNADEGAAEEFLAALRTTRSSPGDAFVDFVLALVAPPERLDAVAHNVGVASAGLRERPALALERRFLDEVLPLLGSIIDAAGTRTAARAEHAAAAREAVGFLGALESAVERDRKEATRLRADAASLEADAAGGDKDRIAHDNRARELRWRAVRLTVKESDEALRAAEGAAAAARRRHGAWSLVSAVIEQRQILEQVRRLEREQRAEERAAQPLRAELETAGAVLVAALEDAETVVRRIAQEAEAAAEAARASAQSLQDEADRNRLESGQRAQRATDCRERIEQLELEVLATVEQGDIAAGDDVSRAADLAAEAAAQARDEANGLARRADEITQEVAACDTEATHRGEELRVEQRRLDELIASCAFVDERAARLGAEQRLLDLAETAEVDVWRSGGELRHRLAGAIGQAEQALIDAAAAAVEEERLLRAVAETGLLPPTRDVEDAVRRLRDAGINAWPGWEWIARTVAPERQREVIAWRPEVAAGVVVDSAGVPERATRVLEDMQPLTLVVAADVDQLVAANESASPAQAVALRAHPGLHDRAEASVEVVWREGGRRQRDEQMRQRRDTLAADRRVADLVGGFLDEWPRDRVDAVRAARDRLAADVDALSNEVSRLAERRNELVSEAADVAARERAARERVTELSLRSERLRALAKQVAQLPALRAELEEAAAAARDLAVTAEQGSNAAAAAVEEGHRQRAAAARLREDAAALARERVSIEHVSEVRPRQAMALEEARLAYRHLLDRYAPEVTDSEVALELRLRREEVGRVEERLVSADREVRHLAETYAASPQASTAQLRREALDAAERAAEAAQQHLGACTTAHEAATAAEEKERPRDRERYAVLDVEPSTAEEATKLAEQAAAAASEARAQVEERRKAAVEATNRANTATARAQLLDAQNHRLRDRVGTDADAVNIGDFRPEPYTDTPEAASALIDTLRLRLDAQAAVLNSTEESLRDATAQLARRAESLDYQKLNAAAKHRCTEADPGEWVDTRAAHIHAELLRRAPFVDRTLEQLHEDRRRVVVELGQLVRAGFQYLRHAETSSTLPDGLGDWSGRRFLRIGGEEPADDAELHARLEPVIDVVVQDDAATDAAIPDGLMLFLQAMHRANRRGAGFAVTILKPDAVLRSDRVDVDEMQTFSGGQKLTAAVLIYCTVARLRTRIRGQGAGGVGVLLLDNPIGKASHLQLLDLQRRVAHALGAQLVFTTAVRDDDALSLFPNRIRLRNAIDRARARTHVVGANGSSGSLTAVRVARADAEPLLPLEAT